MSEETISWTPTQQRLLEMLGDGMSHQQTELMRCLEDALSTPATLRVHICHMRRKLRPVGQNITSERLDERTYYRLVRCLYKQTLNSQDDGETATSR